MIKRPLYPTVERPPVSSGPELDPDPACRACRLSAKAKSPCLPADGTPGGLLVVGQQPGRDEDSRGRVFVGRTSMPLRRVVDEKWDGPVVYDNVTRCYPGSGSPSDRDIVACRPYLRRVLRLARPRRIIALGSDAIYGLLGYHAPILSVRHGYAWVPLPDSDESVPAFFVIHPAAAARNRFMRRVFERDIEWALTTDDPLRPPWGAELSVIETVADSEYAAEELRAEAPWFAFDTEWAGVPFSRYFEITVLAAVSSGTDEAFVWSRRALANRAIRAPLERLLADPSVGKVGHNLKGDNLAVKAAWGVDVRGSVGDTRLRRRLLEADVNGRLDVCNHLVGMGAHKAEHDAALDVAIKRISRARADKAKQQGNLFDALEARDPALVAAVDLLPYEGPKRFAYALVEQELSDRYCARDAVTTARLEDLLEPEVEEHPSVGPLWRQIVSRATDAVAQMEAWGVGASRDAMVRFDAYCELEADTIYDRLRAYDSSFNPASPADVGALLYDKLKLPVPKYTDTGKPSTDKAALARLRKRHPVVDDLLEYRRLEKLRGGYGLNLAAWVRDDGRIHPELKIDGTRTGRLSCVNPPLQTLPRGHSVEGQMIKRAFAAPPGWKILQGDYSQIELRVAAFLSGDPVMISMFKSGRDFHQATAELIAPIYWGIKPNQVGKVHRSAAKCFHPDTEVLTPQGWRKIVDLPPGERVIQAEVESGNVRLSWAVPLQVYTEPCEHDHLVWLKNEGIDLRVTPDHAMLALTKQNAARLVLPEEFNKVRAWPSAGLLESDRTVDVDLLRLAVATQADGSLDPHGAIRWGFTKRRKVERLETLFDLAGIRPTYSVNSQGVHTFRLSAAQGSRGILDLLDGKSFPWWWLELSADLRNVVLDELRYWDGHKRLDWRMFGYYSSDRQSAEVAQAIAACTSRKSRLAESPTGYRLSVKDTWRSRGGNVSTVLLPYRGDVACLAVPSGIVLVRDGKAKVPVICKQSFNFGLIYGMTDNGLAVRLNCSVEDAARLRRAILGKWKVLARWMAARVAETRKTGYAQTWWAGQPARLRPLFGAASEDKKARSGAENSAINTPVQGTASDFMLASICDIVDWLIRDNVAAKLVLTVHDSVIFEVRDDAVDEVVDGAQRIMQSHDSLGVPLKVDFELGQSLGDLADYNAAGVTA